MGLISQVFHRYGEVSESNQFTTMCSTEEKISTIFSEERVPFKLKQLSMLNYYYPHSPIAMHQSVAGHFYLTSA